MHGRGADRPDPPAFPSVIFDDDSGPGGPEGPFETDDDSGLMRLVGVIVVLGIVIAALVLPPISILDRGEGAAPGELEIEARDELPPLPEGLAAASALYDIRVSEDNEIPGPVTLTVKLQQPGAAGSAAENLSLYSYDGDEWKRLGSAAVTADGGSAEGIVDAIPSTVAVLQRTGLARALGLILDEGQAPAGGAANGAEAIVSVMAGTPALDPTDPGSGVAVTLGALEEAKAAGHTAYLGFAGAPADAAETVNLILGTPAMIEAHAGSIVAAAQGESAAGVHIDYAKVDPARRDAFTSFIETLATRLREAQMGLVVSVPSSPTADSGAYDWPALAAAADALWLRAPDDRSVYYEQLQTGLEARRTEGVDLAKVWLVVDRRSSERSPEGIRSISLRDALTLASALRPRLDVGIAPGDAVTVEGVNIDRDANNSGLLWSEQAKAVSFSYVGRGGERTVWIENRFSVAFRLDLARRFGLGGVVIDGAAENEALPPLWDSVATFVQEGLVNLELPYGPYLEPRWEPSGGTIEGEAASGVVTWRAPEQPGVYDVSLVVSDGVVFVGQQISLRVTEDGATPTATPASTEEPTAEATTEATQEATPEPTAEATEAPTETPAPEPTAEATETPTAEPTQPATGETPPPGPPGPAGN